MNKTYLVGDCHSWRIWKEHLCCLLSDAEYVLKHQEPNLWNHDIKNNSNFNFLAWGKGGQSAFEFNPKKYSYFKEESDLFKFYGPSGPDDTKCIYSSFDQIQKEDIVIVWLGYIDIKNNLPKYKNAEEVVKFYVENCVEYFGSKNLLFAEPFPQFKQTIVFPNEPRDTFLYKDRKNQNDIFIKCLNEEIKKRNLLPSISQQEILNCLGMDELSVENAELDPKGGYPLDGLEGHYYKNIFKLFLEKSELARYNNSTF